MFLDLLQAPQGPGEAGSEVGKEKSEPLSVTEPHRYFYSIRPLPGGAGHFPRTVLHPLQAGSRVLPSAWSFQTCLISHTSPSPWILT